MSLKKYLKNESSTVKALPNDQAQKEYYPEPTTVLKFSRVFDGIYELAKVSVPDDDRFPTGWDGSQYTYLPAAAKMYPVIGPHNYRDTDRLFGIVTIMDEDFCVWFYMKADGKCWCAARNTSLEEPKNGGWAFDP